jgi:hypothetical protein
VISIRRRERQRRGGGGSDGGADDDDGGDDDTQQWLDSVAEEAGEADSVERPAQQPQSVLPGHSNASLSLMNPSQYYNTHASIRSDWPRAPLLPAQLNPSQYIISAQLDASNVRSMHMRKAYDMDYGRRLAAVSPETVRN